MLLDAKDGKKKKKKKGEKEEKAKPNKKVGILKKILCHTSSGFRKYQRQCLLVNFVFIFL